ncbi:MAG TPA: DUF6766 family protein [Steroidobacter sp.]|uniref:DUF6766 family protein n=1 Tax=Steroidobacter sp. TaxID=1978227 RepID=UPI002ED8D79B
MVTEALNASDRRTVGRVLRDNGLSLTLTVLFIVFIVGQALAGQRHYNEEQIEHGQPTVSLSEYVSSGPFWSATAENWESEFLQMAAYALFTVFLFQRGSAESKKIGESEPVDRDPKLSRNKRNAPWPVRRGGWVLALYSNSLSLAFVLLFLISFGLHAVGGTAAHNEEELTHGGHTVTVLEYMHSSQFWFESFQNWQSEFLSLAVMVVFSIFLRQRSSPESKPVDAPHSETGSG